MDWRYVVEIFGYWLFAIAFIACIKYTFGERD